MDDCTFHSFVRLSWELREEIWQFAAYQPLGRRSGRIHYIRMDENRNLLPIGYSTNTDSTENSSGYTWDSYVGLPGIWTACRHSHDVAKRFRDWTRTERVSCRQAFVCKRVYAPQTSGGRPVMNLWNDICCITSDSWESLLRPWEPIFFRTKDARGRIRSEKVINIGVKFDPAWNEELKNTAEDTVLRELSPRLAFVIRITFQLAFRDLYGELAIKLMLIDDGSKWQSFDLERQGGNRIFDGDQEYVELRPLASCVTSVPVDSSPLGKFTNLVDDCYSRILAELSGSRTWESLYYSGFFCILLRRDNYVPGRPK